MIEEGFEELQVSSRLLYAERLLFFIMIGLLFKITC